MSGTGCAWLGPVQQPSKGMVRRYGVGWTYAGVCAKVKMDHQFVRRLAVADQRSPATWAFAVVAPTIDT